MTATRHEEVERKYTVGRDASLPVLVDLDAVAGARPAQQVNMVATYFDTEELDLLRHAVTLRRRQGGADEGWHLKEPAGRDTRGETHMPLGRAVHTPPVRFRRAVEGITDGRPLVAVARLTTHRVETALVDSAGAELAVVADDDVRAERLLAPLFRQRWREWEVELGNASPQLLDDVEGVLLSAGARPSGVSSKLARALAEESPGRAHAPRLETLHPRRSSARDVLVAYLNEHLDTLEDHDAWLRGETVHRLRIAARRLRSALTTYTPLFEPGAVDALRDELRWLGRELSDARDSEVLRGHLDALAADEEHVGVPTTALRQRIEHDLGVEHKRGHESALTAVADERYRRLVRSLDAVAQSPALRGRAAKPARKVLPALLERDARRLRRAAKAARRTSGETAHDEALHEVRKKAKRLRYAAESATPVLGKRAKRLAKRAKAVQDALGAHQDTLASRAWLENLSARAEDDPAITLGAGRLHSLEEQRARAAEDDYDTRWRRLPKKHVDRWVTNGG